MSPQEPQPAQENLDVLTAFDPKTLWYIHGEAYDLSDFIQSHPGGPFALVLGRGRDCTALFECYHPFTRKPAAILPKYKVKVPASVLSQYCVDVSSHNFFRLPDGTPEPFWAALKQRCGDHVRKHKIPRTMSWPLFAFFVGMAVLQAAIYVYGYLRGSHLAAMALALCSWMLFLPGHEGIHYAMSDRPWVNQLFGYYSMSGLSNPAMLEQHHNYGHHSFTNDYMRDPDTHAFKGPMRFHEKMRYLPLHKLQSHVAYVSFCFTLAVFGECIKIPIQTLCQNSIMGVTSLSTTPQWVRTCMIAHLLTFVGLLFVLPCYMPDGLDWASVFKLGWTYMLTAGACLGHIALVSHSSEHSIASASKPIGWAQNQVEASSNFRLGSFARVIVTGGSNLQIEHHLFPGLSVEALMQLSPIVQQTCKDFNVTYKTFDSYRAMFHDMRAYLKRLAIPPVEEDVLIAKEPKDARLTTDSNTVMAPIG